MRKYDMIMWTWHDCQYDVEPIFLNHELTKRKQELYKAVRIFKNNHETIMNFSGSTVVETIMESGWEN